MMNRKMLKQAQELQKQMMKVQQEVESSIVESTSGGGVVRVTVTGKMTLESVKISKDVVDPDDVEMLEDLIQAAINEGFAKAQKMASDKMNAITGGMNIPGLT